MSTDTSVPGPRVSGLAASDSALFATLIKEAPMGFAFFDTGLRCRGTTAATRPNADGRVVLSVLLADGEDPAPIRAAVEKLPGVERVVTVGG